MPPRKRDRRSRRDPSPSPSHPNGPPVSSSSPLPRLAFFVPPLFLLVLAALHFTGHLSRSPSHPQPPRTTTLSVYERGLVKRDVSAGEILAEHARVSENRSRRHFPNPVLAYVTPWNSKGYDMAKLFSTKLTHVSPVWYDLKSDGNKLVLEGQHNYDARWVSELQSNASLVVPRFVLEAFPGVVLLKKKPRDKAIDLIVSECRNKGYDGVVLESWSRWAAYGVLDDPELRHLIFVLMAPIPRDYKAVLLKTNMTILPGNVVISIVPREYCSWYRSEQAFDYFMTNSTIAAKEPKGHKGDAMALQFVKQLGEALHSISSKSSTRHHLELIYVIPAPRVQGLNNQDFGPEDLWQLADSVDGFSLMTYDFSGPQNPGPNAPLKWIHHCLTTLLTAKGSASRGHSHMIFLGINFYGNDFLLSKGGGGSAITGRDFIHLLEKYKPSLQWDEKNSEHSFIYSDGGVRHAVFYPTLMSLSVRLDEAQDWGTGLSIWEIGQEHLYFFCCSSGDSSSYKSPPA